MNIKFSDGWGILVPFRTVDRYFIPLNSVKSYRKDAQNEAVRIWGDGVKKLTWRQLYRQGFRAIRVSITPL